MELTFTGKITEIKPVRSGATEKGEWANTEFEVTESNPQNELYPQIGLFDFFKNGEYLKYAKDFETYYPLGTEVTVYFNLKKNEYTNKEGKKVSFYKTSSWKLEKISTDKMQDAKKVIDDNFAPAEDDDLPFSIFKIPT